MMKRRAGQHGALRGKPLSSTRQACWERRPLTSDLQVRSALLTQLEGELSGQRAGGGLSLCLERVWCECECGLGDGHLSGQRGCGQDPVSMAKDWPDPEATSIS